jgi:hypothetical protein
MGANGIDSVASNEEEDTQGDNLLDNHGCKTQTAQTTTPLPRDIITKRRLTHLSTERVSIENPHRNVGVFFLSENKPLDFLHT